jgi:hypothetical protein
MFPQRIRHRTLPRGEFDQHRVWWTAHAVRIRVDVGIDAVEELFIRERQFREKALLLG